MIYIRTVYISRMGEFLVWSNYRLQVQTPSFPIWPSLDGMPLSEGGSLKGTRASSGPGLVVLSGPIYVTTSVYTIGPY